MAPNPDELKQEHERFAVLYVGGPDHLQGNATACYREVYGCSDDAAASGGSRLLAHEGVRTRIRELRDEAAEAARDRMRDWWELVPEAQEVVLNAAKGQYQGDDDGGRVRLQAAVQLLDRAMGTPKEMHRVELQGDGIVAMVAGAPHQPQEEYEEEEPRAIEARSRQLEEEEDQGDPYQLLEQLG